MESGSFTGFSSQGTPRLSNGMAQLVQGRWQLMLGPSAAYVATDFRGLKGERPEGSRADGWNEITVNDAVLPPAADNNDAPAAGTQSDPAQTGTEIVSAGNGSGSPSATLAPQTPVKPKEPPPPPPRDTSTEALAAVQLSNQPVVDRIVKELDAQAHFVAYAPPKFVAFRQGIYLED